MTKTKISDAEALERFENYDPDEDAPMRDRSAVADIEQAVYARKVAEAATEEAVRQARHNGITWTEIASALGVSHQAAIKRYRDKVSEAGTAPSTKKGATSPPQGRETQDAELPAMLALLPTHLQEQLDRTLSDEVKRYLAHRKAHRQQDG